MGNSHSPARAVSDAAWRQFRAVPEYKAEWHGREVIAVGRWFPSSKLCSACYASAEHMLLNVRICRGGAAHS